MKVKLGADYAFWKLVGSKSGYEINDKARSENIEKFRYVSKLKDKTVSNKKNITSDPETVDTDMSLHFKASLSYFVQLP
jgi:hypothetical protein